MKTRTLGLIALLAIGVLTLTGCNCSKNNSEKANNDGVNTNVEANVNEEKNAVEEMVGMANPAAVYCIEQGGTLIPTEDEDGNQYAFCLLADETLCEEWEYYRGECPIVENELENIEEITEEEIAEESPAEEIVEEVVAEEVAE